MSLYCIHRVELMEQLIRSSDLFVMQVEMDVYTTLKKVTRKKLLLFIGELIYFKALCSNSLHNLIFL